MVPKKTSAGKFRYRLIGGGLQLRIDDRNALHNVLVLDEAFWAMTSCDIDSLRFDPRFLGFLDSDGNRLIQSAEVKTALKFLLDSLSDLSEVLSGSPILHLKSIAPSAPNGDALKECFTLIARNAGKDPAAGLTADEIGGDGGVVGSSRCNGDGVIAPDAGLDEKTAAMLERILAAGLGTVDRSGVKGVSRADAEAFAAAVTARLNHFKAAKEDPAILPFGDGTAAAWELFKACEGLIDGYFLNAAAAGFLTGDPARIGKIECSADLMVPGDVRKALETAVAAVPTGGELDFDAKLNPLFADKLRQLAASPALADLLDGSRLSPEKWAAAKARLAPYGAWLAALPPTDGLAQFTEEELQGFLADGALEELERLSDADLGCAAAVDSRATLFKLALYQQYFLEFLNNFVALPDLFDPKRASRLQMGKLIMDGRHFTLTVPVKNVAEHKRIIQSSDICVLYVEINRNTAAGPEKKLLAVAVTGGTMRTLFIGKHGVFFDTDGNIWDARIADMVEQPVSIWEAFKSPFFRFADFLGKQAERIFNTRNAELQKNMSAGLNNTLPPAGKSPAPAAAPASNLPMMLMGGGIGIAALGSSVAFIAKSLQNVSFWTVLAVVAGIIAIFGGPMIVISLIKLYRRNLSRFLESCGCAVNRPMRLTRRMGAIFTFAPKRPKGELFRLDPAELFNDSQERPRHGFVRILLAIVLILLLGGVTGALIGRWYLHRHAAAKTERTQSVATAPAKTAPKPPAAPVPAKTDPKPTAAPAAAKTDPKPTAAPAPAKMNSKPAAPPAGEASNIKEK